MINFISKYYNSIILAITILSLFFLISNNFSPFWLFKFYDSYESYANGNGIWNNILTGFICSAIFYWIVEFIPNYKKEIQFKKLIDYNLNNIYNSLNNLFEKYSNRLYSKSVDELTVDDIIKIENFILYQDLDNTINYNIYMEIMDLYNSFENILNEIDNVYRYPNSILTDDILNEKLSDFYKSNFVNFIIKRKNYYKNTSNIEIAKSNEILIINNLGSKLYEIYLFMKYIENYLKKSSLLLHH